MKKITLIANLLLILFLFIVPQFIGILCVLPKYKYYLERIVVLDF